MTVRMDGKVVSRRPGRGDHRILTAVSPLPPPEEVFFDWLMSVPADGCLEAAARWQIEIIDRSPVVLNPDVLRLRTLFVAMAGKADWNKPISNL